MRFLVVGLGLGLGAGLAPGPLLALVVTSALARGFAAGLRVALSPLVTDTLMIAVAVLLVRELPNRAAGILGVVGGLYVVWLGVDALRERAVGIELEPRAGSLRRGALVNLLSPHPWLFWIVVGGPVLVAAWAESPWSAVAFLVGFFGTLVGTKAVVAAVVAGSRRALTPAGVRRAHVAAAVLLLLTGVVLVVEFAARAASGS
ncbi:MAG: LysE family translocator [Frankiales bacterium]|nr:LysE family translocator [Frankiales bacterium]